MTDLAEEDDSSDLASLIGEARIPFEPPRKRLFAPWHLPRKQYVRHRQWFGELERMAAEFDIESSDFNYLSLPGDDLLDVRYLRDVLCEPRRLNMRFLGFNRAADPESDESSGMQSNLHAIKLLDWVDQMSNVIPDDIRSIGSADSVARQRIYEFGGFHAINLDLCDGFARHPIGTGQSSLFDALRVLIEIQGRTSHDSVLMITTRVGADHVSNDVAERLEARLVENIVECEAFEHQVREQWAIPDDVSQDDLLAALTPGEQFILGLSKWIVSNSLSARMSVAVRSVLTYRVANRSQEDDLVSIALRLSPMREMAADTAGIAIAVTAPPLLDQECAIAAKVPARISHRKCVDDEMRAPDLLEMYLEQTEQMLLTAGYDVTEYREWAAAS